MQFSRCSTHEWEENEDARFPDVDGVAGFLCHLSYSGIPAIADSTAKAVCDSSELDSCIQFDEEWSRKSVCFSCLLGVALRITSHDPGIHASPSTCRAHHICMGQHPEVKE